MSTTNVRRFPAGGPGRKWWLPALLALLILAIILGAFFATHPHIFGGGATKTPTPTATLQPTATSTPKPHFPPTATPAKARPTATLQPGPTGTPRPGPTGTPRPGPTSTPKPAPTATTTPQVTPTPTIRTGAVSTSPAQLTTIQQGASSGNSAYTYYLHPFQVVQRDLPKYGFTTVTIVSPQPPPQPTPTPYTGNSGLPEVQVTVHYQGKSYLIVLDQPKDQGATGIWVIVRIKPL